ncbi:FUSC family protein [Burkholderia sp. MR1-5-21]
MGDVLRGGIVCATPAVLAAVSHTPLLSWSAIAAFWTCFCDPGGSRRTRLRFALAFGAAGAVASGLGAWVGAWPPLALVLAALTGFAGAFAGVKGPKVGLCALLVATDFAVSVAFPAGDLSRAVAYGAYFLYGNLWAVAFAILLWHTDPLSPARRAVAVCYLEMSRFAGKLSRDLAGTNRDGGAHGAWRVRIRELLETARSAAASAGQGPESGAGSRWAIELAFTAEQSFVALVALEGLLAPGPGGEPTPRWLRGGISAALAELDDLLAALGPCFASPGRAARGNFALRLRRFDASVERLEMCHRGIHAARRQGINGVSVTAALRQVSRAVHHLIETAEIADSSKFRTSAAALRRVATSRRDSVLWDDLVANFNSGSIWLQHAIRVALASALSVALVQRFTPNHGYWLSLTVLFLVQPNVAMTLKRSAHRIAGTMCGALVAAALGYFIHSPLLLALAVLPLAIGTLAARSVSYWAYALFLTAHFILVAQLGQPSGSELLLALARVCNSVAGAALAIAISMLAWPRWEKHRVTHALAAAIEAAATYVTEALRAAGGCTVTDASLHDLRRNACMAVDAAEVSFHQMLIEPRAEAQLADSATEVVRTLRSAIGTATLIEVSDEMHNDRSSAGPLIEFAGNVRDEMARSAAILSGKSPKQSSPTEPATDQMNEDLVPMPLQYTLEKISWDVKTLREVALGGRSLA